MTHLTRQVLPQGEPALDITSLSVRATVQVLTKEPRIRALQVSGDVIYRAVLRHPEAQDSPVQLSLEPEAGRQRSGAVNRG